MKKMTATTRRALVTGSRRSAFMPSALRAAYGGGIQEHSAETVLHVVKQFYSDCLQQCITAVFEESVVAGGAVRDSILGKRIKDIDIFVPMRGQYFSTHGIAAGHHGLQAAMGATAAARGGDYDDEDGFTVFNIDRYAVPIQIIYDFKSDTKHDIVSQFHNSLSRAYFNPVKNEVCKYPSFEQSVRDKTCVYSGKPDSKYMARLQNKYSDYKFIRTLI